MATREYYNIEALVKDEENARAEGHGGPIVGGKHRRIDSPFTLRACRSIGIRYPNKELLMVSFVSYIKKEAGVDVPPNVAPDVPVLSSSSSSTATALDKIPGMDTLAAKLATQKWLAREQQRQVRVDSRGTATFICFFFRGQLFSFNSPGLRMSTSTLVYSFARLPAPGACGAHTLLRCSSSMRVGLHCVCWLVRP
jgi:hypothetical protein